MKSEDIIAGFAGVGFQRRVREAGSRAKLAEPEVERRQVSEACQRGVAGKLRGGRSAAPGSRIRLWRWALTEVLNNL